MLRALHTAATGMEAQQLKIDVVANNLANVNTTGFKKSRADFQELLYQTIRGPGVVASATAGTQVPTGIQVGLGVRTGSAHKMFTEGALKNTGNQLDIAIEGKGFFQIIRPNGEIGYSRAGNFKMDQEGRLATADGYLLEPQISIPEEAMALEIAADGSVSALLADEPEPTEVGRIELVSFINPAGLLSLGRNLYSQTAASGAAVVGSPGEQGIGSLSQGFLESSNVKVVDEMIEMIVGQRAYEMNSKVVQAADQMLREVSNMR